MSNKSVEIYGAMDIEEVLIQSPIGVAILDTQTGRRLFVNDALVKLFHAADQEELLNRNIAETWVRKEDLEAAFAVFKSGQNLVNKESERFRLDGERCWILTNSQPITYNGHSAGIVWHQDITEQKKAQLTLRQERDTAKELARHADDANRAKSSFLSQMSHELRTPLNAIIGFSQLMAQKAPSPNRIEEYSKDIFDSGNHLLGILNNVLEISKIQAEKIELDIVEVELRKLIEDAVRMVRTEALKKKININVSVDDFVVDVDIYALSRAVVNLLSNAIKYSSVGSQIWIIGQTDIEKRQAKIVVRDEGIGIDPDVIGKIHEPFQQSENTYIRKNEGIGLGLAIVDGIMTLHGGSLKIDSEVNVGTTATLSIPFQQNASLICDENTQNAP